MARPLETVDRSGDRSHNPGQISSSDKDYAEELTLNLSFQKGMSHYPL